MKILRYLSALLAMLAAQEGAGQELAQETCPTINHIQYPFMYPVSADAFARVKEGDLAREALAGAQARLRACAGNEANWYAILRARELLGCDPRRTLALADEARRALPRSVWIATVRARLLGTVAAAREATALDPSSMPAKLALATALLDDGQVAEATALLRKINSKRTLEAKGLKARLKLDRGDHRGVLLELRGRVLGTDIFVLEPSAGLDWPWNDDQVQALAEAELGKAEAGAGILYSTHVGTLHELRVAVAEKTGAAQRLMTAMGRLANDARDPAAQAEIGVALARLRFIAGETDEAARVITIAPAIRASFCASLPELTWILSAGDTRPVPQIDKLQAVCSPQGGEGKLPSEPPECLSAP